MTLCVKVGATFLQSQSGLAFDWATPGALAGLVGGTACALVALPLRRRTRAALAGVAVAVALVFVNLLPVNPYFDVVLADWRARAVSALQRAGALARVDLPYTALGAVGALFVEQAWLRRRAKRV